MSQRSIKLDQESFSCSICLNLLEEPVTLPCGHNYCMACIRSFWGEEEEASCPQCRRTFTPRPELLKNTMLAAVVEQLKLLGSPEAPEDHQAGAGDVTCDVCSGVKLRAVKSCLVCLVSYCHQHLQPHHQSATFEKHRLVEPSRRLQENICPRHGEVMRMFCRTDQRLICYLCSVDEHKGHDAVSVAAERTERQKELVEVQKEVAQRIREREDKVLLLEEEVEAVNVSADKAVEDIDRFYGEMLQALDRRCSDGKQKVRTIQDGEVSHGRDLQEKLEQEIRDLRRTEEQLKELCLTEDHSHFLQSYSSLPCLPDPVGSSGTQTRPLKRFEDLKEGLTKVQEKLQSLLGQDWSHVPATAMVAELSPSPPPQPSSRADFLRYSRTFSMDPNSAHPMVVLSHQNKRATFMSYAQPCPKHPDRFLRHYQVLSREGASGRCYWEVSMKGRVYVAVSYRSISRSMILESGFGLNGHSWALHCEKGTYMFYHDGLSTAVDGPGSNRIGVYLDQEAGVLSFYRVSEVMTLIHSVQTLFTALLHAGVCFYSYGDMAEFINL